MIIPKLKLHNYISYGMGDIFGGGAFTIIASFFLLFLTKNVGLSPILAGLLLGMGRFWIAILDPIIGTISDNIKSRFGRRRVFFLIGILPILVTFTPMWFSPLKVGVNDVTQAQAFIYYLSMYFIFDLVYCSVITPYAALVADMTKEYSERIKLSAFRMGFSQLSSILVTLLAPIMLMSYSYSDKSYVVMAASFSVLFSIIWIFVFLGTREIPVQDDSPIKIQQHNTAFKKTVIHLKGFYSTFKNKSFRAQLAMFLLDAAALDLLLGFNAFYVKEYLHKPELLPYVSSMWIAQVLVLPIYVGIANKYSKVRAYQIGAVIWICSIISLLNLTPLQSSPLLMILHFGFVGLGLSACYMIPQAMLSFVAEVDVLISKKQRTGVYAGAMSFSRKMSQALIILPSMGLLLSVIGYESKLPLQAVETLFNLKLIFILIPLVLILLAFYCSFKFKITPHNFEIIKAEIKRLSEGGRKLDVDPKTCSICEQLTGYRYADLYKDQD